MLKKSMIFIFILSFNYLIGQEVITTYKSDFGEFNIEATKPDETGNFEYYIETQTWQGKIFKLVIELEKLSSFKSFIEESKPKYLELAKFAERSNANEAEKLIDKQNISYAATFYTVQWHFSPSVKLQTMLHYFDGKSNFIIRNSHEIFSNRDQFTSTHKFVIALEDEKQINSFLNALNPELVYKYYSSDSN